MTCTTYSGNAAIGTSTCDLNVTTDEAKCKPTVSGTVVDTNAATIALTGDKNILVRYCSTIAATLNKSAGSIKAKTINNVAVSGNTLTIANVETGVFDFWAKDSREYPGSDKEVKTLVLYEKLTNNAAVQRTDPTSGNAELTLEGNYFNGSFGASSNALTVKYRQGSGSYVTVTPTISGNKYTATVPLTGLDYTQAFSFEVVVSDKISTVTKKLTLQKGIPVFDWGESDFAFNVPVSIMGNTFHHNFTTLSDVDSFAFNDNKLHLGYGIVKDGDVFVGYLGFYISWIALQFKIHPGGVVYRRAKYGDSAWSTWTQV